VGSSFRTDSSNTGTLSALQLKSQLACLPAVGISPDAVLAACGFSRGLFDNPLARFPATVEHRLWEVIEELANDPCVGLRMGSAFARRGPYEIELYLALNAGTLRRALRYLNLMLPLLDDRGHIGVEESGTTATLSIYRDGNFPRPAGYVDGLLATTATLYFERVPGFRFDSVDLTRPRPKSTALYLETLRVMPSFGCALNCARFERALLDAPLRGSDVKLGAILLQQARELVARAPYVDPLVARVQSLLSSGLERGQISLSNVARATGTSPRTLRRKLSELGTSFQHLLDELRREFAAHYLRNEEESVASVAGRLGFTSTSAFQRASQRWHGMAPSAYRAQLRAARSGHANGRTDPEATPDFGAPESQ
jgi:AraC-like DNA-binding protein